MRITCCVTYLLFVLLVENVISQQYVGASVPVTPSTVTTRTTSTRATPATRTPTRAPSTGPLKVGDKSKQKCQEYGRYVYAQSAAVGFPGEGPSYDSEVCAVVEVENIVGREDARPKEFPHMALVGFDNENNGKFWFCGGALISDKFVLTAGHCLYPVGLGEAKFVRLGELIVLDTNQDYAEPQDFTIRNKFQHPNYRPTSLYNDIGLLELDRSAKLHPYVRPACLNTNPTIMNSLAISSGWGESRYNGEVSKSLQKITLELFTNAECNNSYQSDIGELLSQGIVETQLCAGSRNESRDTCEHDSGSPLQISNTKEVYCTYKIIGVMSFDEGCITANIPGVYTRVSNYIKWIENIVWP